MSLCTSITITQLGVLLKIKTEDIRRAVAGFTSILSIPISDDAVIQPFHASLYDFFTDMARSNSNPVVHHMSLMTNCLRVITGSVGEEEVIRYACTSWCHHLRCVLSNDGEFHLLSSPHCWNSQGPSGTRGSSYVCRTTTGQVDWRKRVRGQ